VAVQAVVVAAEQPQAAIFLLLARTVSVVLALAVRKLTMAVTALLVVARAVEKAQVELAEQLLGQFLVVVLVVMAQLAQVVLAVVVAVLVATAATQAMGLLAMVVQVFKSTRSLAVHHP